MTFNGSPFNGSPFNGSFRYCGDSVLGHGAHFGCQALTANLPLLGGPAATIVLELPGATPHQSHTPHRRRRSRRRKKRNDGWGGGGGQGTRV